MKQNNSQKRILRAAEEEFLEKGFAGARTTEIARRAGVNVAMLHYYYDSKESLFGQVMDEKIAQLQRSLATVFVREELPVEEKIAEVVVRQFDFLCENPDLPRFVINELASRPEYVERVKAAGAGALKEAVERMQRELDAAAQRGEVRPTDAATLLMDILSVNIFPFIVAPIMVSASPKMDFRAYFEARMQENVQLILDRISPVPEA